MKKYLLLIASLFVAGNVRAYTFTIKDFTPQSIQVKITYAGAGVCSPDTKSLKAWTHRNVSVGGCCLKTVKVRKTSGTNTATWYKFYPSRTGAGISCRSSKMKVTENPDGTLNLESY